jgi:HAD superfamily hydrolase (TIGR01509 family)
MQPLIPTHTFRAALFDWDGVIIDSHHAHEIAWDEMALELGIPLPPGFFKATFGMRNDHIIPNFTDWATADDTARIRELGDMKEARYRKVLRRDGIEPLPGVRELLAELRSADIPCSVGSSTSLENIQTIMEMTGLGQWFQAITAERDVSRGKPDPQVFQIAAQKVNCHSADCVVFEDAHVGIQAALAAGSKAIAVGTTHPLESFHTAHLKVMRLTEISLPTLKALWA